MANWDKIYRDYKKGGNAWATLDGKILPEFKRFIKKTKFKIRNVLDIGCGTGVYLLYLLSEGFKVSGIDSSPTAISMSKKLLRDNAGAIKVADMFKVRISKNKYDLIFSTSAIHHGYKNDIKKLIDRIHSTLIPDGKAFITLPDLESSNYWTTFDKNDDLGDGTFSPKSGPEKGIPHSLFTQKEIKELFVKFGDIKLSLDKKGRWIIEASR